MTARFEREALKPCPFCGGEARMETVENRWTIGCEERLEDGQVLCYGYQSLTTFATRREAIAVWNRRADAEPSVPDTGEREKALEDAVKIADAWCEKNNWPNGVWEIAANIRALQSSPRKR